MILSGVKECSHLLANGWMVGKHDAREYLDMTGVLSSLGSLELSKVFILILLSSQETFHQGCLSKLLAWRKVRRFPRSCQFNLLIVSNLNVKNCLSFSGTGLAMLHTERKSEMGTNASANLIKELDKLTEVCCSQVSGTYRKLAVITDTYNVS